MAGHLLSEAFRVTAAARRSKPLHPKGELLSAVLSSDGVTQSTGVPWIDEPGRFDGQARLSRAVGLGSWLPDIPGLALRWQYQGQQCDLLFAGTGLSRAGRFTLTPRWSLLTGPMTTLLPLRSPRGPLLFAVTPSPNSPAGADPQQLARDTVDHPFALRLAYASVGGPWTQFGSLWLTGPYSESRTDPVVRFSPVDSTPVGLQQYEPITRLRRPSYAGARKGFPTGPTVAK